jgi:NAD(P)-dependent dehydrogenase (short-subunit alcohol dehydrogenase family)
VINGLYASVLLGADHLFGLALARDLVSRGYVVIASVSRAELADELESHGAGFIRALVLNPTDPTTLNPFLRDMRATLGLRFPLGAAGDPYASPASHAHIVSLVSLLSLTTTDPQTVTEGDETSFMPLSSMSLTKDYLPLLISSHVTPFGIIQGVLPHLRNTNKYLPKSHPSVVILQSVYTLGPGRNGADAIVTTANTTALDVFRRELREQGVDVFELDVGKIDAAGVVPLGMKKREAARRERFASQVGRTPSSFEVLADAVADVVGQRNIIQWWRGSKRPVGAGGEFIWVYARNILILSICDLARTYALASRLPTRVLDSLLSLPRTLLAMRNPDAQIDTLPAVSLQPPRIQTSLPPRPGLDSAQPSAVTPNSSVASQSAEASPAEAMHHSQHSYDIPAGEVWNSGVNEEHDSWVSLSGRGTPAQV